MSLQALFAGDDVPSWKLVLHVIKSDSSGAAAREVDPKTGNLPLHWCCANAAPLLIIEPLLKAYPEAAKTEDDTGLVPIFHAVANEDTVNYATHDAIAALIKANPKAVKLLGGPGKSTPLHYAACNGASIETVKQLIKAWPEACLVQDVDGNTPLHFAAANKGSPAVVKALLKAGPQAAKMFGHKKRLPLGLALLQAAPAQAVMLLQDANRDALREQTVVADFRNGLDALAHMPPHTPGAKVEPASS